jgi:uncharacterized protein
MASTMHEDLPFPPMNVFAMAVLVEGGMGLLALGLGWLLDLWPADTIQWDPAGAWWGLAATVPLVAVLVVCVYVPIRVLRELLATIDRQVVPLFAGWSLWEMALVAGLAGLGEEMLFRGIIQNATSVWIGGTYGPFVGLIVASVLFGSAHALSSAYAVLATGIGLYLGGLWIAAGNLLVPVVAHAVYDFAALVYLVRGRGRREG